MTNHTNGSTVYSVLLDRPPTEKVNDYWIERFVRFSSSLDAVARSSVEASVQRHRDAAFVERFYREFYDVFDAIEPVTPPRVQAFIDRLLS
jgi:hypothetical protein